MPSDTPLHISSTQPIRNDGSRMQQLQLQKANEQTRAQQVESTGDSIDLAENAIFNPLAMSRRFESLKTKIRGSSDDETQGAQKKKENTEKKVERISAIADEYARKSQQELKTRILLIIKDRITKDDTPDDILRKVLEAYPDYAVADEVLDFLIATSDEEIANIVKEAKTKIYQDFKREIVAGRNINEKAREFSTQGLGNPTALRDIYRDITGNPREPTILFDQLSNTFPYEKMKQVIEFLLHALGQDLKAKGSSIPRGELHRLVTETRILQAILGVYYYFEKRMKPIASSFERKGIASRSQITFQKLARLYIRYIQERYPNAEKILQMALELEILDEYEVQAILFIQLRDATRQIAPRLFRSEQHRQDVLKSFMDALSQIDEEIEKEEEQEEENKDGKKRKKQKKPPEKLT